jgi:hypothetical protein
LRKRGAQADCIDAQKACFIRPDILSLAFRWG